MGKIEHSLLVGGKYPTDLRPPPATTPYHKKVTTVSFRRKRCGPGKGRITPARKWWAGFTPLTLLSARPCCVWVHSTRFGKQLSTNVRDDFWCRTALHLNCRYWTNFSAGCDSALKFSSMTNSWKAYKIPEKRSESARKAAKARWSKRQQESS
jgi:hypothetical protein